MPVDMNGMLLRGTTLKNSGKIVGLVVYTGPESRIQMNAAPPPRKRGTHTGCSVLPIWSGSKESVSAPSCNHLLRACWTAKTHVKLQMAAACTSRLGW